MISNQETLNLSPYMANYNPNEGSRIRNTTQKGVNLFEFEQIDAF